MIEYKEFLFILFYIQLKNELQHSKEELSKFQSSIKSINEVLFSYFPDVQLKPDEIATKLSELINQVIRLFFNI